jgi:hypothetical protein
MLTTEYGNRAALLVVDLFWGYKQVCPLKDKTTNPVIAATDATIIRPFRLPKFLRSDQQTGLASTTKFFKCLKPMGTKYFPTSVGSPWGNGHAERSIRTTKEATRHFFIQEKCATK